MKVDTFADNMGKLLAGKPTSKVILHCVPKNVPLCHFLYLHQILTDFQNFFHWHILWTISNKIIVKYLSTHLTVLLHYHVKHKFSKITKIITVHTYAKYHLLKQSFANFHTKIKFCLVLRTFLMFINKSR